MNNYNNYNNGYEIGDVLNAISILLGYQNLLENRQQSAYNDVHSANDEQAERLLSEITRMVNEQNNLIKSVNNTFVNHIALLNDKVDMVIDMFKEKG